jgi:hypothetical protein
MRPRYYTLYERPRGTKTWKRISDYSYKKDTAIRVYQSRLLDYLLSGNTSIERRLRPVPADKFGA